MEERLSKGCAGSGPESDGINPAAIIPARSQHGKQGKETPSEKWVADYSGAKTQPESEQDVIALVIWWVHHRCPRWIVDGLGSHADAVQAGMVEALIALRDAEKAGERWTTYVIRRLGWQMHIRAREGGHVTAPCHQNKTAVVPKVRQWPVMASQKAHDEHEKLDPFDLDEEIHRRESAELVRQALAKLPERTQVIVRRHHVDGHSHRSIAADYGMDKSRVGQILKGAMERMRDSEGLKGVAG